MPLDVTLDNPMGGAMLTVLNCRDENGTINHETGSFI